jgi:hypothetical protein
MEFQKHVITNKGKALLAKAEAGVCSITFTRAVIGNGEYNEDQLTKLEQATQLQSEKASFGFSGQAEITNEKQVLLSAIIRNNQLEEGYFLTEYGIFATDPTEGEILYALSVAALDKADWLVPYATGGEINITIRTYLAIGMADKVDIIETNFDYVSQTDFEAHTHNYADADVPGGAATRAVADEAGHPLPDTYATKLGVNGKSVTLYNKKGAPLNSITTQDTVYTHPLGSGHNHVPTGGAAGDILEYTADGNAKWSNAVTTLKAHTHNSNTGPKMNGTQAVGVENTYARGDHIHPVDTSRAAASHTHAYAADTHTHNSATSPKMNGTAAVGSESMYARGDHVHPVDTSRAASSHTHAYAADTHTHNSATSPKMNGTAAVGSESVYARGDHVHPVDTSRAASSHTHAYAADTHTHNSATSPKMNGTAAVGSESVYARGDHVHPIDTSRAAASHTHAYAADTHTHHSSTSPKMNGTATVGSESVYARGDHIHPVDTSRAAASHTHAYAADTHTHHSATSPKMNGTAAVGSESVYARGDHVHPVDTSRAAASHTHSYAGSSTAGGVADKATRDESGNNIKATYAASLGVSGNIVTLYNKDGGVLSQVKTQDIYTHLDTTGNKHIPSGGSSGQILRWSADGTAVWGSDNNTTYAIATQSANGLMSAADKVKVDNLIFVQFYSAGFSTIPGSSEILLNIDIGFTGATPLAALPVIRQNGFAPITVKLRSISGNVYTYGLYNMASTATSNGLLYLYVFYR